MIEILKNLCIDIFMGAMVCVIFYNMIRIMVELVRLTKRKTDKMLLLVFFLFVVVSTVGFLALLIIKLFYNDISVLLNLLGS